MSWHWRRITLYHSRDTHHSSQITHDLLLITISRLSTPNCGLSTVLIAGEYREYHRKVYEVG